MTGGGRGRNHPSPAELDRFLLGEMSPRQAAPVVAHLVRGCETCRQRMAPLASAVFANGPVAPPSAPASGAEYDFPVFKAFATARLYAETGRLNKTLHHRRPGEPFPQEVPSLEALATPEVARDPQRYCEALLERCRSLRFNDPEGMILAASFAVVLAERMASSQGGPEELADLQAGAWAELGNAHRAADDLASAEAALARALDLSGHGTGDPLLLARLMDLTASLYTEQRRFEEAHRLLDWVYAIYRRAGDKHLAARALISKGISVGLAFESEKAVDLLERGILLVDAARDPKLTLAAVHGLLWYLLDCGQVAEVETLLHQVRGLYMAYGEPLVQLRAQWLEGRVAADRGEDARAAQTLLQVRAGFQEAELPYTAAMASLDLAAVWLRQGRTVEIQQLVDEMVAIFRARNIQREAIGALLMLRQALQKDQATAALLRTVATELRRLERLPAQKA
jgi:tetratricopeptide (TPR) repeat protein